MKLIFRTFLILFILPVLTQNGFAQDNASSLEEYTPPPLFAEPKLPPAKIKKPKVDVLPSVSKEVPMAPSKTTKDMKASQPRIIKQVDTTPASLPLDNVENSKPKSFAPAPVPNRKPDEKTAPAEKTPDILEAEIEVEDKIDVVPEIKTDEKIEEPIDFLKPENKTQDSVVTGPKTMPSNKKEDVLSVETFKNDTKINLIKRTDEEVAPAPSPKLVIDAPEYPTNKTQSLLKFIGHDVAIADIQIITELTSLSDYLVSNDKKLEIKAYASLTPEKPNSDRRIALNRGLAVREFLISKNIEAHRINLKSFGNKTTRQPADFVEINILD